MAIQWTGPSWSETKSDWLESLFDRHAYNFLIFKGSLTKLRIHFKYLTFFAVAIFRHRETRQMTLCFHNLNGVVQPQPAIVLIMVLTHKSKALDLMLLWNTTAFTRKDFCRGVLPTVGHCGGRKSQQCSTASATVQQWLRSSGAGCDPVIDESAVTVMLSLTLVVETHCAHHTHCRRSQTERCIRKRLNCTYVNYAMDDIGVPDWTSTNNNAQAWPFF